jgi:hypothetical protein
MAHHVAYMASLVEGELRVKYLYPDNSTATVLRDVVTGDVTPEETGTAVLDTNGNPTPEWFAQ